MPLTPDQLEQLNHEVRREDLQAYTAIRMARRELAAGNVDGALATLRVDADKIRSYSPDLYALVTGK